MALSAGQSYGREVWWQRVPLFCFLLAGLGGAMVLPAIHGLYVEDWRASRSFLYVGLLTVFLAVILGLSLFNRKTRMTARAQLTTLVLAYFLLPLFAAMPLLILMPDLSLNGAYFEMLSSFTTTGATLFDAERLSPSLHLWRALTGWLGGFLILLSAAAIMQPLNLGGFEVRAGVIGGRPGDGWIQLGATEGSYRLMRTARLLAPIYVGLTAVLAILLVLSAQSPFTALCHAMAILSTSGITPHPEGLSAGQGRLPEVIAVVFLVLAASHHGFRLRFERSDLDWLRRDRELRMMALAVLGVTICLFGRHWLGAISVDVQDEWSNVTSALWGSAFTTLSFLTTAGFESVDWQKAQSWSGLGTSGLILLFVATIGGGVASTAGGVKLLRVYALFQQGVREMDRLTHPHSIGGAGEVERRIRRQGASVAWVFLMLFLLTLSVSMLALGASGVSFEHGISLTIAALTNTGPVYQLATPDGPGYDVLDADTRLVLCVVMVLGRLEALAVIALLSPSNWR